jgi:hypothetical protein
MESGLLNGGQNRLLCLWLVVWSNPNSEIQISEKSAEIQEKSSLSERKSWTLWSCYPDLNWGPHPYQLP